MDEPILEPETSTSTDVQESIDLNAIADETFARYQKENFNFVEINYDSTKEPIYNELRAQYGENLTKEQVQIFNQKLGGLNCALVTDWQVADIRENHPNVTAQRILMAERINDGTAKFKDKASLIRHALVHLSLGEKELFYEPQSNDKFKNLDEAKNFYKKWWPIPKDHYFLFAYAY